MNDLEARLRAFAPPVRPPVLPDTDVAYVTIDSPVGPLVLAATRSGLVACSYDDETTVTERIARAVSPRILRSTRRLDPIRQQLETYFAGQRTTFTVPVDLALASPFATVVLRALRTVLYGTTVTYGELARTIGRPRASRAVGSALNRNPVCIILPCHRVVRTDGSLAGYAGGVGTKQILLRLEREASS